MNDEQRNVVLWHQEYEREGIPSSYREEPSGSVVEFARFLRERGIISGVALDLGCGQGRNSLYLAEQGFDVYSVDFVPENVAAVEQQSVAQGIAGHVHPFCQSVTEPWRFVPEQQSVDVVIDTFCYKHQITSEAKAIYRRELANAIRPGGLFLLTLAGIDDGYYGPLLASSPLPTEKVIVDPANGIKSVLYTPESVLAEFAGLFSLEHLDHKQRKGIMHGNEYQRSTYLFILARR